VRKSWLKKILDRDPSGGSPSGVNVRPAPIANLDEALAFVMSGGAWESAVGYQPADPHRPALTAHAENMARRVGAWFFGKKQQ
jgi:hypothetical protein